MIAVVATVLLLVVAGGLVVQLGRQRALPAGEAAVAEMSAARATRPTPTDPVGVVVEALRARRWLRRSLSALSVLLLLVAVGMIGYPFFTNVYSGYVQNQLEDELTSPETKVAYEQRRVEVGDSLTRIQIPAIDVDVVVVEGTTNSALRAGAGHYRGSALPCEQGNVAIAGHRTTFGRPFHNLDRLKPGDTITLITPIGRCTYRLERTPWIVPPTALEVVEPTENAALTLTTCHPKGSARQRLVARASLASA